MNRLLELLRKAGRWIRHAFAFGAPRVFVPGTPTTKAEDHVSKSLRAKPF